MAWSYPLDWCLFSSQSLDLRPQSPIGMIGLAIPASN